MSPEKFPAYIPPNNKEEQLEFEFHYDKEFFEKAKKTVRERFLNEDKKSPRFTFYELYAAEGLWKDDYYKEREDYFTLFLKEIFGVNNETDLIKIFSKEKGEVTREELRRKVSHPNEKSVFTKERRRDMMSEAERRERSLPKDKDED